MSSCSIGTTTWPSFDPRPYPRSAADPPGLRKPRMDPGFGRNSSASPASAKYSEGGAPDAPMTAMRGPELALRRIPTKGLIGCNDLHPAPSEYPYPIDDFRKKPQPHTLLSSGCLPIPTSCSKTSEKCLDSARSIPSLLTERDLGWQGDSRTQLFGFPFHIPDVMLTGSLFRTVTIRAWPGLPIVTDSQ